MDEQTRESGVAGGDRAATRTTERIRERKDNCEGRGHNEIDTAREKARVLFLLRGEYNNAREEEVEEEKKGARDGWKRTNLGAIVTASTAVENLVASEGTRGMPRGGGRCLGQRCH